MHARLIRHLPWHVGTERPKVCSERVVARPRKVAAGEVGHVDVADRSGSIEGVEVVPHEVADHATPDHPIWRVNVAYRPKDVDEPAVAAEDRTKPVFVCG